MTPEQRQRLEKLLDNIEQQERLEEWLAHAEFEEQLELVESLQARYGQTRSEDALFAWRFESMRLDLLLKEKE